MVHAFLSGHVGGFVIDPHNQYWANPFDRGQKDWPNIVYEDQRQLVPRLWQRELGIR
jgi:hypothetical protein